MKFPVAASNGPIAITFYGDGPWRNRRERRAEVAKARRRRRARWERS